MVKVSVIMPVYNAEKFLKDSVDSILNQSLSDLELICADDGSSDNSLNILNDYAKKDSRVKVFSLNHQGGGNARNYALTKITGEYLYIMDADDILDLNAFQEFYSISKSKNLDFLIFKAINYDVDKEEYYETEYYNMPKLSKAMKDKVFNFKDLGELIFKINTTPWCKFYNTQFIKKSGAKFRENSKFHDNQFFWDIIFQAKRICFLDEFYYTRTRHSESLTASGDEKHINIIGVVNDIITLFIKHDQLDNFKTTLFNRKVVWIIQRYYQIQDKYKELFHKELKNDFELSKNTGFVDSLWNKNKFIYNSVLISKNYKDLNLLLEYVKILDNKEFTLNDIISNTEIWFNSLNKTYQTHSFKTIKFYFEKYNAEKISSENRLFYNTIINSSSLKDYTNNHEYQLKAKLDSLRSHENKLIQYIKENENENNELLKKLDESNLFINKIYKEILLELKHVSINSNYSDLEKLELNMKNQNPAIFDLNNDFENFKSLNILKDNLISDLNKEIKNCHGAIEYKNNLIYDLNKQINKYQIKINEKDTRLKNFAPDLNNYTGNGKEDLSKLKAELEEYKSIVSKNELALSKLTSENKFLIKKNEDLHKVNLELKEKLNQKKGSIFKR